MMHRNLDRRVEALVRLSQADHIKELHDMFDLGMSDEIASWSLDSNGTWNRTTRSADGQLLPDYQNTLMSKTLARKKLSQ